MGRTSDARERLIDSAGDLWHRRSYTDVGVSEICEAAGVQKGSFYHFFPSKQDLALAVIDQRWEEIGEGELRPLMTSSLPPLERVLMFLRAGLAEQLELREAIGACPGCSFGNLAVELASVDEVLRQRLESLFGDWAGLLRIALDDAVAAGDIPPTDTDRAARALLAYVEGLSVMAKTADDPTAVADLMPLALHLVGADPDTIPPPARATERTHR
jgi:TetR/AcrR family transcriptional repressor of nem operon